MDYKVTKQKADVRALTKKELETCSEEAGISMWNLMKGHTQRPLKETVMKAVYDWAAVLLTDEEYRDYHTSGPWDVKTLEPK